MKFDWKGFYGDRLSFVTVIFALICWIIFISSTISCKTRYQVLGYDRPDFDSSGYVYLLERIKFPKMTRQILSKEKCECLCPGDTVFFTRENGYLIIHYIK